MSLLNRLESFLLVIVVTLSIIVSLQYCGDKPQTDNITIPEKKGTFEPQEPKYVYRDSLIYLDSIVYKDTTIYIDNPINKNLALEYKAAKDTIEKLKLYLDAIQIRQFKNTFEDSLLKLTISGEVQGHLNYLQPDYTIKERHIEITNTELVFRILLGGQIESNEAFNDLDYNLNLSLQNKRNRIYGIGYSRKFGQNYYSIRYEHPIFELKK